MYLVPGYMKYWRPGFKSSQGGNILVIVEDKEHLLTPTLRFHQLIYSQLIIYTIYTDSNIGTVVHITKPSLESSVGVGLFFRVLVSFL